VKESEGGISFSIRGRAFGGLSVSLHVNAIYGNEEINTLQSEKALLMKGVPVLDLGGMSY